MPRIGQSGADSGDFRPPRPHAGRQAASRVGAIEPFGGTLDTRLRTFAKPARRYRHESTGRNQTETDRRLTAHRINALKNSLPTSKTARPAPQVPRVGQNQNVCAGRLYQCRQIQPVQPADQVGHICERPAFRHSRHDGAAAVHQSRMQHYPDRYRRIRQRSAAQTDFGIFRHAGRNRASRCAAARRRCRCPEQRTAD